MSLTRRQFLATSLIVPPTLRSGFAEAIEPIKRPSDKPDLKLSLAAYSYRQFLELKKPTMTLFEFIDTTRVTFCVLDEATIERYVAKEQPLDCAGGFKSEALGIALCESIDSADPTALIGLPLIRLSAALRKAGFEVP